MAKRKSEAEKRLNRLNHNQYSAWIQWRALIDVKTAEWIMQDSDMRSYIDMYRAGGTAEKMQRELAVESRERFKRRCFEKWREYYEAIEAQNDARG